MISYLVTQRSAEIGVRMALVATSRHAVGPVMRHTLRWTRAGAAWAAGRYLESMLFGVKTET